jgi:AcrR family transcriptional regulator
MAAARTVRASKAQRRPPPRVYGGQSNVERREDRRARLVATGLALFGTEGYGPTTIEGICSQAGVTARHFYEQFESREALLRAVYDDVIAGTQRAIVRALAHAGGDTKDRVAAGVAAFVHAYLDDPRCARIACIEAIGVSAGFERHRRSVIHAFASVIEAQAELLASEGRLPPRRDYELTGIAMAGAVNELMSDWIMRRDRMPIAHFIGGIVDFFLATIQGGALLPPPTG